MKIKKIISSSIITSYLIIAANITSNAQENNRCNFEIDKTDEFTFERIAQTKRFKIISQTVGNASKINVYVTFKYNNGKRMMGLSATYRAGGAAGAALLVLNPAQTLANATFQDAAYVQSCYIQFSDKSNFKLESDPDEYQTQKGTEFFILTDEDISRITKDKIIKMRLAFGRSVNTETTHDCEIKEKVADDIQNAAKCIANIKTNMPKTESNKRTGQSKQNSKEMPVPKNDTATVTLYKQWKFATQIDSSGSLVDLKFTYILQFFNNGTYICTSILKNGTVTPSTGKFQLLNENKILVMTPDGVDKSTSSIIAKLTKTELHTKHEKSGYIYVAY
ncbi:MAG: hypothetical protein HY840_08770 [Bacteroidetes bacterium]|nr:hypothetical protein [Bacteroidota bacterium]